jgi:hypothetical protein
MNDRKNGIIENDEITFVIDLNPYSNNNSSLSNSKSTCFNYATHHSKSESNSTI